MAQLFSKSLFHQERYAREPLTDVGVLRASDEPPDIYDRRVHLDVHNCPDLNFYSFLVRLVEHTVPRAMLGFSTGDANDMNQTIGHRERIPRSAELASPRLRDVLSKFEQVLREEDLFAALGFLNSTTTYRFTGVYCFEPGLVKSLVLVDRENSELRVGSDVPWFDSYCMMTAEDGRECEIQNSLADARLRAHTAREKVLSYCAVLLRMPDGEELGTLCHYDVCAKETAPTVFEGLRACRTAVERYLWERVALRRPPPPRG